VEKRIGVVLQLICGLLVCVVFSARPYVAPEFMRSRKFVAAALAGGGLGVLLMLLARHKMTTAVTEAERKSAQRLMKMSALLGAVSFGSGAFGAFSNVDPSPSVLGRSPALEAFHAGGAQTHSLVSTGGVSGNSPVALSAENKRETAPSAVRPKQGDSHRAAGAREPELIAGPVTHASMPGGSEFLSRDESAEAAGASGLGSPDIFPGAKDPAMDSIIGVFSDLGSSTDYSRVLFNAVGWSPISLSRLMVAANAATPADWEKDGNYYLFQIMASSAPVRQSMLASDVALSPGDGKKALWGIIKRVVEANKFKLDEANQKLFDRWAREQD